MRIERFGHAAIKVRELRATEAFYTNVLGFHVAARYPEDHEVIFGFGAEGHLLVQAVGKDAPAPDAKTLGVHHLAFVVDGGERALGAARAELRARDIAYRDVDHGDHRSVYFQDPDGHMLELYHVPGAGTGAPVAARLERAREFLFGNARRIECAAFEVCFGDANSDPLIGALEAYRNGDGGFGHALEPDLRAPFSQPLHTEFALQTLMDAGVRRPDIAQRCCDFLASIAAPDGGLPAFLPGALDYPAAEHWRHGLGAMPSLERTCGGVSLLAWHGANHPWLTDATTRCERYLADARIDEAHHLSYAFQFASIVLDGSARDAMLERLRRMLDGAEYYIAEPPVERYGLTPLRFAPSPDAPARRFFDDATIVRHLDDLERSQQSDGGWTIRFAPPTPAAASEWRGYFTLEALRTLRAYGRL